MKKKLIWIGSGAIILILFMVFIIPLTKPILSDASELTAEEAKKIAVERYAGTVSSIEQQANEFVMKVTRKTGLYELKLNANTGEITSLKKIVDPSISKVPEEKEMLPNTELGEEDIKAIALNKKKGNIVSLERKSDGQDNVYVVALGDGNGKTTLTIDAVSGIILKEETENTNQVDTKLTEQEATAIALVHAGGTGTVEEIWLQTVNGIAYYNVGVEVGDDHEYIIKINSITGEVQSITLDDDDDDYNDDDDDDDDD
jgi:uncharacterized membrane protein YkoI